MELFRSAARVGCLTPQATAGLEEWSPIRSDAEDRTRLTDPLAAGAGMARIAAPGEFQERFSTTQLRLVIRRIGTPQYWHLLV